MEAKKILAIFARKDLLATVVLNCIWNLFMKTSNILASYVTKVLHCLVT